MNIHIPLNMNLKAFIKGASVVSIGCYPALFSQNASGPTLSAPTALADAAFGYYI